MAAAVEQKIYKEEAEKLLLRKQAFIDGRYVDAASGKTFSCISPIDGKVLCDVAEGDKEDVDRAVAAARKAFEDGRWSKMAPAERKKVLTRFSEILLEHRDELAILETLDMGKPVSNALGDVAGSARAIRWFAESIDKVYGEISPSADNAIGMIRREPMGVVGAIVPWNFPLLMASWKIGPILAAGNSCVLKPAEQSPLTAIRIAELASEAGVPDGVLNIIPGYGPTAGQALARHMDVDALAFTGSGEIGKLLMIYAGESNMKRVSLECGGKSPHIVFADTHDLDAAATAAAWGIFYNQGEVCTAGSRLLLQESIHDEFMDKVINVSRAIKAGDPLDPETEMGAIVDEKQMNRILNYIDIGKEEKASLVLGGQQIRSNTGGYYVEPTIFDAVDNKMRIAQEEIFGPVLSVLTFKDAEEAAKIGNDTIYGLAAALWTSNINRAHKLAKDLRAGSVWVNCYDGGDITTPFGGYKQSGFGRDKSLHALDKFTELKTIWIELS